MTQTPTDVTLDVVLRRALADRRWSGRQLATESGIKASTVARILRGERDATVSELTQIAGALGVTAADLLPESVAGAA